jgi:hypothetical protein
MATFGCVSSAGIYDSTAKVVLDLVTIKSGMDERMTNQILDDVVTCGAAGDGTVQNFYVKYREVAARVGVRLADESDPDKAFSATHTGKVFGISYDLKRWVWWLSEDKMVPLLLSLAEVRDSKEVENRLMQSVNGKLNHYMWLVPGGPWQRGFLLRMQDSRLKPNFMFPVTDLARLQAAWWMVHLRVAAEESRIMDPRPMGSMLPCITYGDAAGGDTAQVRNGAGAYCPPYQWTYLPWSSLIRENRQNSLGVRFGHKLSVLEGVASLLALTIIAERARNTEVLIKSDNIGLVEVFKKKHCSCPYLYTMVKAIFDVGEGLGARVRMEHSKRCSGVGELVTDALSKGEWGKAWPLMPRKNTDPERIPVSLLLWVVNPIPDMGLGTKILSDMRKYTKVLHLD